MTIETHRGNGKHGTSLRARKVPAGLAGVFGDLWVAAMDMNQRRVLSISQRQLNVPFCRRVQS
jgi:hypothetical protein